MVRVDNNKIIGERIRVARVIKDVSQKEMANFLGVTFQQSRKYELGVSKISAYKLFLISRYLKVPLDFFFQPLDEAFSFGEGVQEETSIAEIVDEIQEDSLSPRSKMQLSEVNHLFEGEGRGVQPEMDDLWRKYISMDAKSKEAVLSIMQSLSR